MARHVSIEQAAKDLGMKLVGQFPDIVGVSLLIDNSRSSLKLYVDLSMKASHRTKAAIPDRYQGYRVHVRRVNLPQCGSGKFR